jgi:hypothetical protein
LAGLAQLSQDTSISGFFLEAREDPQKNKFWSRQQDHKSGCGKKLHTRNKKKLVVGFIIVTPTLII